MGKNCLENFTQTAVKDLQEFGVQCVSNSNECATQCFLQTDTVVKFTQNIQTESVLTCEKNHQTDAFNVLTQHCETQTEIISTCGKSHQTDAFNVSTQHCETQTKVQVVNIDTKDAECQTINVEINTKLPEVYTLVIDKDFNAQFSLAEKNINDFGTQTSLKKLNLSENSIQTESNLNYTHFDVQTYFPLPSVSTETQTVENIVKLASNNMQTDNKSFEHIETQCDEVKKSYVDCGSGVINDLSVQLNDSETQTSLLFTSSKQTQCGMFV